MTPQSLKEAFQRGENITEILRRNSGLAQNTEEIIETAYDLQTGSYIKALDDPRMVAHKQAYGAEIAARISCLTDAASLLEVGVGEGTTMSFVVSAFEKQPGHIHGIDISWSRLACCRHWLGKSGISPVTLAVGSIFFCPYHDDSFDVVYTSHSIEPNGGNERAILAELYRITSRYLVLLEPAFELASAEARARMEHHGYCRDLVRHSESLGMKVTAHELFPHASNPLNPTALTVIEKAPSATPASPRFACPRWKTLLEDRGDSLYSPESLCAYPKIKGIPCLRPEDAVIASAYDVYSS